MQAGGARQGGHPKGVVNNSTLCGLLSGQGRHYVLTPEMVDGINAGLDRLSTAGSPGLQSAIAAERARTHNLQDFVDRNFDQALETLGVTPPSVIFLPVVGHP